jgi:hypothetical protein
MFFMRRFISVNALYVRLAHGGSGEAVSKPWENGEKRPGEHVLQFAGNAAVSAAKSDPMPHSFD